MISHDQLLSLSSKSHTGVFLFEEDVFKENFLSLLNAFSNIYPKTQIAYSYKTNYTPYICRLVNDLGGYAEVVSEMEYNLARRLQVEASRIIYNGPSKSFSSLEVAVSEGAHINVDSLQELNHIVEISNSLNKEVKLSVRVSFLVSGNFSRFGLDVSSDEFSLALQIIEESKYLSLVGLHCHFPDRDLDSYVTRVERILQLISSRGLISTIERVNLGGGFFGVIPPDFSPVDSAPNFIDYAQVVAKPLLEYFSCVEKMPTLFIEPGTALVANTFRYYCRVLSIKNINGEFIATVNGSLFVISPTARCKTLPVKSVCVASPSHRLETYKIAGFTCIEGDILTNAFKSELNVGDFLEYSNVGSYSIVMKPPFILPAPSIYVHNSFGFSLIKNPETLDNVFDRFVF